MPEVTGASGIDPYCKTLVGTGKRILCEFVVKFRSKTRESISQTMLSKEDTLPLAYL
jgi:hypothetical protein